MKIIREAFKKEEEQTLKIGDVMRLRNKRYSKGEDIFIQVIAVGEKLAFLNLATAITMNTSFDVGVSEISKLLKHIGREWTAWNLMEVIDSENCEVFIPR